MSAFPGTLRIAGRLIGTALSSLGFFGSRDGGQLGDAPREGIFAPRPPTTREAGTLTVLAATAAAPRPAPAPGFPAPAPSPLEELLDRPVRSTTRVVRDSPGASELDRLLRQSELDRLLNRPLTTVGRIIGPAAATAARTLAVLTGAPATLVTGIFTPSAAGGGSDLPPDDPRVVRTREPQRFPGSESRGPTRRARVQRRQPRPESDRGPPEPPAQPAPDVLTRPAPAAPSPRTSTRPADRRQPRIDPRVRPATLPNAAPLPVPQPATQPRALPLPAPLPAPSPSAAPSARTSPLPSWLVFPDLLASSSFSPVQQFAPSPGRSSFSTPAPRENLRPRSQIRPSPATRTSPLQDLCQASRPTRTRKRKCSNPVISRTVAGDILTTKRKLKCPSSKSRLR